MSWDTISEKEIKCPCGNGTIKIENQMDDWNRYRTNGPYICCNECKKKYRVVTFIRHNMKPKHGDFEFYKLVPVDFDYKTKLIEKYKQPLAFEVAKKDFAKYLVYFYTRDDLKEALNILIANSSVANLIGSARCIAKDSKNYLNSATVKNLTLYVQKSLEIYLSIDGNYEQLKEQEKENYKLQKIRDEELEEAAIDLDL